MEFNTGFLSLICFSSIHERISLLFNYQQRREEKASQLQKLTKWHHLIFCSEVINTILLKNGNIYKKQWI